MSELNFSDEEIAKVILTQPRQDKRARVRGVVANKSLFIVKQDDPDITPRIVIDHSPVTYPYLDGTRKPPIQPMCDLCEDLDGIFSPFHIHSYDSDLNRVILQPEKGEE